MQHLFRPVNLGIGTVPVGRVESGQIRTGMKVQFAPSNLTSHVASVEKRHEPVETGLPGDQIGFNVPDLSVSQVKRGMVCGGWLNDPPSAAKSFTAQVISSFLFFRLQCNTH